MNTDKLNCDTVDMKPIDFDFGSGYDFEETGGPGSWRLAPEIESGRGDQECTACEGTGWIDSDDPENEGHECKPCEGNGTRDLDNGDPDAWMPMMNYAYPIRGLSLPEDWRECLNNMTAVEIDGETFLALTGGGMDFSWEICETFIRLGYRPPAHFAELPGMAGRGESETDRAIVAACKESLQIRADWATRARARLEERHPA